MRTLKLLVIATALAPAVGCKWLEDMRANGDQGRNRVRGKIEPVAAGDLVDFLNKRAARLRSVEYDNVHMHVAGKDVPLIGANLAGELAVAQPRNFRMLAEGKFGGKVVMGSNDEQFWVYMDAPGGPPVYVYATHADFQTGRARMPNGLPFEPDWVMQALGMSIYPAANNYEVAVNERERTYTLWWLSNSVSGGQVRKEVVFDADAATGSRPQVRRHVIRDAKGTRVIASADIKSAETVGVGTDPVSGLPLAAQYPTRVVLKWADPQFEMDLTLEKARANQATDPTAFARPEIRNTPAINLAGGFPR
jgi:hypothetical protein